MEPRPHSLGFLLHMILSDMTMNQNIIWFGHLSSQERYAQFEVNSLMADKPMNKRQQEIET